MKLLSGEPLSQQCPPSIVLYSGTLGPTAGAWDTALPVHSQSPTPRLGEMDSGGIWGWGLSQGLGLGYLDGLEEHIVGNWERGYFWRKE